VKSNKVFACCGVFTKQCDFNTKIDSPSSVNGETSFAAAGSRIIFKSMGTDF